MDLQSNEARRQEAHTLVQHYIQSLVEKDVESWMSLWDENGILEFPFAPQGRLPQVEGKAALSPYIQAVIKDLEILRIPQQQIHLTLDADLIIVEITYEGRIVSTGRIYHASYVWVMRTKDGKLIHVRDYWNPLAVLEARGGLDVSTQNSKVSELEQS